MREQSHLLEMLPLPGSWPPHAGSSLTSLWLLLGLCVASHLLPDLLPMRVSLSCSHGLVSAQDLKHHLCILHSQVLISTFQLPQLQPDEANSCLPVTSSQGCDRCFQLTISKLKTDCSPPPILSIAQPKLLDSFLILFYLILHM